MPIRDSNFAICIGARLNTGHHFHVNGRGEAVSPARDGRDVDRLRGIIAEDAAEH